MVAASALVLTVTLVACPSDDEPPAPDAGSAGAAPTTSSVPGTTIGSSTPVASTAPTAAPIPGGCPSGVGVASQSAQQAARCLFQTWEEGNRTRAVTFASLDVVDVLFRERWSPPTGTFDGCSAKSGSEGQVCTMEHRGTRYLFDVRRSEGGWRVTQLQRPAGG